ncbi:MAG: AAA family ATPase [Chlorobiaceae bacterium]
MNEDTFSSRDALVTHLRNDLKNKKFVLLYAYNGTGKTLLSMDFKNKGKNGNQRDTIYFNAFTEDLFTWNNDLDGDTERYLKINKKSRFFNALDEFEMDNRIRPLLHQFADFDFEIDSDKEKVRFSREIVINDKLKIIENIKISRGEENTFIWCFFLSILELVMDDDVNTYEEFQYVYIDDPISSLDDNNAVRIAVHLAQLLKKQSRLKSIVSSHHPLFFNVMCNELGAWRDKSKESKKYFLKRIKKTGEYKLKDTGDTPLFEQIAVLEELQSAADSQQISKYHFGMLRSVLERTSAFFGINSKDFINCIDTKEKNLFKRATNLYSHGNHSLYALKEMNDDDISIFRDILEAYFTKYPLPKPAATSSS